MEDQQEIINKIINKESFVTEELLKKLNFKYNDSFGDEYILISPIKYQLGKEILGYNCFEPLCAFNECIILDNNNKMEGVLIKMRQYNKISEKISLKMKELNKKHSYSSE